VFLSTGCADDYHRLLLRESEAAKRTAEAVASVRDDHPAGGLIHPGCKFVPWKGKVVCAEGIDTSVVLEVVRSRHVPPLPPYAGHAAPWSMAHHRDSVLQAIEKANARAMDVQLPAVRHASVSGGALATLPLLQHRVAVLMAGLVARDAGRQARCTARGKQRQLLATRSQVQHVFGPLQAAGFSVHLFLAIDDCRVLDEAQARQDGGGGGGDGSRGTHNFTAALARAYGPWLADFQVASCDQVIEVAAPVLRVYLCVS